MKKNITLKVAIATVGCFIVAGALAKSAGEEKMTEYWQSIANKLSNSGQSVYIASEETFTVEKLNEVTINSTSLDIKIEKSKDAKVHLFYYREEGKERNEWVKIEGQAIKFDLTEMENSGNNFKFNFTSENLGLISKEQGAKLLVPATITKLKIQSVSGAVKIVDLNSEEIQTDLVSGNCKMEGVHIGQINHQSISGDLKIEGGIRKLKAQTVSGNIKYKSDILNPETTVSTTSGDVRISFNTEPDINLKFATTSGEIRIDRNFSKTEISGSVKDLKLGKGLAQFDIDTVSGDVAIEKDASAE